MRKSVYISAASALAVTLVVSTVSSVRFAYESPRLHLVLETAEALVALLAAHLVLGRTQKGRTSRHLLLAFALGLFGLTNLALSVLPSVLMKPDNAFYTWTPVTSRAIATGAFAAAALIPRGRLLAGRFSARWVAWGAAGATLLLVASILALLSPSLPAAIEALPRLGDARHPRIEGHAVLLGVQLVSAALYLLAAFGFTRDAARTGDRMMQWFGAGAVLAAFARVHYFLSPSLYSDYVYVGDLLRLGFYVMVLLGAATEIEGYWQSHSEAAALEERRRVARDLHDGLAQELVFIAGQASRLRRGDAAGRDEAIRLLGRASERAVAEARRAISSLVDPIDGPVSDPLARVLEEIGIPASVNLELDLDASVKASPEMREGLIRIAREAVCNSVEHARASRIEVALRNEAGISLTITDDGIGIGEQQVDEGGFGIPTMRERAAALGGRFTLSSAGNGGTRVEVVLG